MKICSLLSITIGKRPKGTPRWQWRGGRHKIEPEKTENRFIKMLAKIMIYGIVLSLIAVPILFFYTLHTNSIAGQCFNDCRNKKCKLTEGEFWCYQWRYIEYSPTIGSYFQCDGNHFSTKEECVEGCFDGCPPNMSWKYTVLAGIPIGIIPIIWLCLSVGEKVETLIKNRRR